MFMYYYYYCAFNSVYSLSLCCYVYCLCVNVYCTAALHRVSTQLQLTNVLYIISFHFIVIYADELKNVSSYQWFEPPPTPRNSEVFTKPSRISCSVENTSITT